VDPTFFQLSGELTEHQGAMCGKPCGSEGGPTLIKRPLHCREQPRAMRQQPAGLFDDFLADLGQAGGCAAPLGFRELDAEDVFQTPQLLPEVRDGHAKTLGSTDVAAFVGERDEELQLPEGYLADVNR